MVIYTLLSSPYTTFRILFVYYVELIFSVYCLIPVAERDIVYIHQSYLVVLFSCTQCPPLSSNWESTLFVFSKMDVRGKVSIITGSAQGLGKAFAARLLEAGGKVCISDVNQAKGEATLAELRERFGKDR